MKTKIIDNLKTLVNNDIRNNLINTDDKKELSIKLSNIIKNHIKTLTSNEYKIIVEIFLNDNKDQGVNISTRLFYNKHTDFFFKETIINDTSYCFIVVYLIHI
ncbi:dynein light chain, putative [Plasmodium sp. gorilla clade G3]|nr:dynein light chain, putative [Plasmodium sp. gorilla clade G3]